MGDIATLCSGIVAQDPDAEIVRRAVDEERIVLLAPARRRMAKLVDGVGVDHALFDKKAFQRLDPKRGFGGQVAMQLFVDMGDGV